MIYMYKLILYTDKNIRLRFFSPLSTLLSVGELKTGQILMSFTIFLETQLCLCEFKTGSNFLHV